MLALLPLFPLILAGLFLTTLIALTLLLITRKKNDHVTTQQLTLIQERLTNNESQRNQIEALLKTQQLEQTAQRERFDQHQIQSLKLIQETLYNAMSEVRNQVTSSLNQHGEELGKRIDRLIHETQQKLKEISGEVDKQLASGFEKTTLTFNDVMKRLIIIDEAQKKIVELSGNVISLQEILGDKRSRGAFGEVQLQNLIVNLIPENHFRMQEQLSNGKRVDCLLLLPEPTGNIAIDAKFPLETFRLLENRTLSESDRKQLERRFKQDITTHIQDVAEKYIIPGETSDGAVLFIPAEVIFAEIHAHYPELVEMAHHKRVWLVSPTTLMAILTTARAVLKDAATRNQILLIQQHLTALSKDFSRFQERMDRLSHNIKKVHEDVEDVHISSKKISGRFNKIEKVDLQESAAQPILETQIE